MTVMMVVMLLTLGPRHPRVIDEDEPLGAGRIARRVFALVMFILCFTPVPIELFDLLGGDAGFGDSNSSSPSGRSEGPQPISLTSHPDPDDSEPAHSTLTRIHVDDRPAPDLRARGEHGLQRLAHRRRGACP